jgi:hypothetical protein
MACGGGGSGDGDDAPPIDAPNYVTGTYSVTWGPYTAQPGEEGTKCVELRLGNPGPIHVHEIHNDLGQASHHFIVYRKATGTELTTPTDCTPFVGTLDPANGAPLMITQKADETLTLPEGVSFTLQQDQLVRLEMHYVNATDAPIDVQATAEFRTTLEATQEADFLFAGTPDIDLPARNPPQPQRVGPVYLPFPPSLAGANVFAVTGHTHELGTDVEVAVTPNAGSPGQMVYQPDEFSWDEPETTFHRPAFQIPADGGFRFTCDYLNDSGRRVGFGEDANDEMCFFWLYYYPSKGAKICIHTDQQGGHDVCCPADEGSDDAVICALLPSLIDDFTKRPR